MAAGLVLLTAPEAAWAACNTSGNTVTCTPGTAQTTRIGNGDPSDNVTVNVQDNAQVTVGNDNAISLGDSANITLGANSTVSNNASSGTGRWNAGPNTIEFGSNGRLTIGTGATVAALGTSNNGEPINVMGSGNVVTNYGTVTSRSGAAIWFEDRTLGSGNTIDNYGIIRTQLGANSNVIGNQGNSNVTFINRTGARVEGSLSFAGGNDALTLETGSVITGSFNGGGGTNTLSLSGAGNDSLAGDIRNFQTLTKDGTGRWTLTGAIGANGGNAPLQVFVNNGTLALTGNNANFNGSVTVASAGTLEGRAQSLPPTIADNGLVRFVQDTAGTYSGAITGTGAVEKTLGGDLTLAGANSYSGGTTINAGIVHIASDTNLGAASGLLVLDGGTLDATANVTTARTTTLGPAGGGLSAAGGATLTHNGTISGQGLLAKSGAGTVILNSSNSYAGGTVINAGTLQVSSDANLGAGGSALAFDGGTLRTTANMTTARNTIVGANGGTYETAAGTTFTNASSISGTGTVTKTGGGTMLLTGTSSYTGGTRVAGGTIEIASDAALGDPAGLLTLDGGTLRISQSVTAARNTVMGPAGGTLEIATGAEVNYSGSISGSGSATKTGGGTLYLTGTSSYTGGSTIAAGSIFINGDLSGATGPMTVQSGARLSGGGVYGGSVTVDDGGRITAGAVSGAPGVLGIGSLTLNSGSNIFLNIVDTTVGGPLNDLINVNGDLVLDGRIDVLEQDQTLGPGVYRIINYTGALTDNTLDIGSFANIDGTPTRPLSGFSVQTAIPGQVNLINTQGLSLTYWDGTAGPKNNNVINGGVGTWHRASPGDTSDWTDPAGAVNAPWQDDQFAIFVGTPGTVAVSSAFGSVTASGMQFGVDGYVLQGDPLTLVDSSATPGASTIRVGDGTARAISTTATIDLELAGTTTVTKTDLGTLILNGANSYTGGTAINGGVVQISSDANLGAAAGALTLDGGTLRTTADIASARTATLGANGGTFETGAGTTLTLSSALAGPGILRKSGTGTLLLTADSGHGGGTIINAGTVQLGNGGTAGAIEGPIINQGTLLVNRSNQLLLDDVIAGAGSLTQAGTGTTVLAANNLYTGTTTISAGTLQLGNGGATGTVAGPIVDNATLAINRSNDFTLSSAISGTGALVHNGPGRTILTGTNSYTGGTTVAGGRLYVDGDQSAATGAAVAMNGTRLGGSGVIGGNVTIADGATLSPGSDSLVPGTLTINGSLGLNPNSTLLYNITSTVVGDAGNDLTVVGGDLTLDGTINVVDEGQTLGPGVYRIFNYAGALIDNGLTIGGYTSDGSTIARPLTDFIVQTVIPNQVNLINVSGADLNYWDGSAIANESNNLIDGGSGTWRAGSAGSFDWTDPAGALNAPWADGQFAIFLGMPGTVTASNDDGDIRTSGMQFGVDGYVLQAEPDTSIILVGSSGAPGEATIRVGDGTAAGAAMTATIDAPLTGDVLLRKTDAGTLILNGVNTFTGGARIEGGVVQIASDTALGTPDSRLTLDGGTLRMTASLTKTRPITMGPSGGVFDTVTGTTTTIQSAVDGTGSLGKAGDGTLVLVNDNTYTGGTIISAGTLQIGNGGTTGHINGDIVNNATLVINRSDTKLTPGVISGTGRLIQAGTGTTVLQANNTYTGGTIISAGTLQIGDGGTTGHVIGDILNNSILVINRSDTKLTPAVISGTGQLVQAGTGTTVLQADNTYTGGTTIAAGTLQIGDGGTVGSIVGDVANNSVIAFNRSDTITFAGAISGPGSLQQIGTGTTILTGANTYTGGTTVSAGTLQVGDGGTSGQIFGDILNNGTVILNRSDDILYAGNVSGSGSTIKEGAGTLYVTGTGTYTGGTTINAGVLQLGTGGTSGSIVGDVVNNAALVVNRSDSLLLTGVISGTGRFEQAGTGTTIFEANNTYTGGTLISGGTLQIGNGGTTGLVPGDVINNGRLVINRSNEKTLEGVVSGTGEVVQAGLGTLIINNTNTYSGGTAVEAGVLQISRDDNLGAASGGLRLSNGTLRTTADMTTARTTILAQGGGTIETVAGTTLTHNGLLDGAGALTKTGGGRLILTGGNSYAGPTDVMAGTLWVYGDQSAATGATTVFDSAILGGIGTIGGDVTVLDGGTLAPGDTPGTLTVAGDMNLNPGSILDYEFGEANVPGGPLNDLTIVNGNLVLDGTIDVTVPPGGSFGPGVYRVFDYGGTLTDNGLAIGTIPDTSFYVQTSIAGQVNLVNITGLTLNYWDGAAGPKNDGVVNGGDGLWQNSTGNDNWTTATGTPNAPYSDAAFAVFQGAPGAVTVDASLGPINASGMWFGTSGYTVSGAPINLVALPDSIVRVGDGTAAGAAITATVDAELAGSARLVKTDLGTLVLTGANSYTGGTLIAGGVLQVASDANLGAAAGDLAFAGGTLRTTADMTTGRAVTLGGGGGTFDTAAGTTLTLTSAITGNDGLTKSGGGTLLLTADSTYGGSTTVGAGTLQLGNGGTGGSIVGDIVDNGILVINRSNALTLDGTISGSGSLVQAGPGTTILNGDNSYTGTTQVNAGLLYVNGDQSLATGTVTVATGAQLGGTGIVGGDTVLAEGSTLRPGAVPLTPGTLTFAQDLTLADTTRVFYNILDTTVGGPLNDLVVVGGNLVLDGTIDVLDQGQDLGPGVYRVFNYAGTLTDNTLDIGSYTDASGATTRPLDGFVVQTSVANQVNLVNTGGVTLRYWDGAAGPKNDGVIQGGDGTWQNFAGNDNWTLVSGTPNAPFTNEAFAVFTGAAGNVTVDDTLGAINVSGMQFAVDGYAVAGDPITLAGVAGDEAIVRVGDGTAAGAGMTATVASVIGGAATLNKTDLGTLILTGANTYSGGTAIDGGVLQIASDANLGGAAGALRFDGGTLRTTANITSGRATTLGAGGGTLDTAAALTLTGTVSGPGALTKTGTGTLTLTGANIYTGATTVSAGALYVEGNQSGATGVTTVADGATLGGSGTIGGNVAVAGTLSPGSAGAVPGTLTIAQDLTLAPDAQLAYSFGQANVPGGPFNDLTVVGGDLVLDGTIDVTLSPGGSFDPGVYRVIEYAGALTDNGLAIGSVPAGGFSVQTSVAGQVNLVNTAGLTLNFWDGAAGPKNDGVVNGGNGSWQSSSGNDNWTNAAGIPNAPFTDGAFAVFMGSPGTVTVDNALGAVTASGMQFMVDGYLVQGGPIGLTGAAAVIRVGDGTAAGSDMTATVGSVLAGGSALRKSDLGTLVLSGANTYTGGTTVDGGVLQIASDANLGAAAGALAIDGATLRTTGTIVTARAVTLGAGGATFETAQGTALTVQSPVVGPGALTKTGAGDLILNAANSYAGPTAVRAGTLAVGGPGSTGASITGPVTVASGATLGGYGTINGNVASSGTIAVADALGRFAGGGPGQLSITGTLTAAGPVNLAGAAPGNRLAAGSYVGQGATVTLNTVLAGDDSPTDQLVINGGTATGSSLLRITNVGGGGAETPGNGIAVVVASNGATTAPGAFAVNERLVAGPYEYNLFRGGRDGSMAESWFLRSQRPDTGTPAPPPSPPPGPAPEPEEPLYRDEVPTYTAVPAMALMFGRSTIGTLHDRLGAREQELGDGGVGVWGRAMGERVEWDAPDGGVYNQGPAFSTKMRAFQAGFDALRMADESGSLTVAGIYGLYGQDKGRVKDFDMTEAGRTRFDAYAGGLYATHYDPAGWYADAVAQVTRYQAKAGSGHFQDVEIEGTGYAASLEFGKAFPFGNGLSLEPQAQVIYQTIDFADTADEVADVQFADVRSLAGRLGLRLTRDSVWDVGNGPLPLQGWLRANVWREFMADPETSFSSADGFVPFRSNLKGTWAEIGGGVSGEVAQGARLYASGSVQTDFGKQLTGWDLRVGFHLNW